MPICNYSVSAEYSVRYSAEYFGRNRFRSDSRLGSIKLSNYETIAPIPGCAASSSVGRTLLRLEGPPPVSDEMRRRGSHIGEAEDGQQENEQVP